MKAGIGLLWSLFLHTCLFGQEPANTHAEQELETLTEFNDDAEPTDDSWLQEQEYLLKNKLDLNKATETELAALNLLSAVQIAQFLTYRNLLGKLISIYEIQAIPGWDLITIQKIRPYVTVNTNVALHENLRRKFSEGEHRIIARYGQVLQKAQGFKITDTARSYYAGGRGRMMIRYKYQYKNLLQYGLTASKDAGETFFKAPNRYGFDFYSFHFFSRPRGLLKAFAAGDYTVNMGQGLIHWQALAFGKSNMVTNVKRQAPLVKPYNASGAYYFNRGMAATFQKNKWASTLFMSVRNLDARLTQDTTGQTFISSIHLSGYHRTQSEIRDKNNIKRYSYGSNISFTAATFKISANMVQYHFNFPLKRDGKPYILYALAGRQWSNYSLDYTWTHKNLYFFGETAIDKNGNLATINSFLASIHPRVDVVAMYRQLSPKYQSVNGNAFTASTLPSNEKGIYAGVSLRLNAKIQLNGYVDVYSFPWLKYRVDAPSTGMDYLVQLSYKPLKTADLYTRLRVTNKSMNSASPDIPFNQLARYSNRSWRTQINYTISRAFSIRQRFELLWYLTDDHTTEQGFLGYFDLFYKPAQSRFSINCRVQYFDSDGYNSRLYAYENDVLYYYAIPVFYNKGIRWYVNLQYRVNKKIAFWCKFGHTLQQDQVSLGSGLDEIQGNTRSEIRLLASIDF